MHVDCWQRSVQWHLTSFCANLDILPPTPNLHGLFYDKGEMTLMILQNIVLGPDLTVGTRGDTEDPVDVSIAHGTRK